MVYKKVELAANVAIIAVACLLATVLVKTYLIVPRQQPTIVDKGASFDSKGLSDIGIDWKQSERTLILALSTGCHFCTESAPFYRQLATAHRSARLIALLPQPLPESQDYLNKLGVKVDDVRQVQFGAINISGTPTLILVDANGVVTKSWIGKLAEDDQKDVLKQIS